MAWIWKQKINYSDLISNSNILRDTGWKSPNNIKQDINTNITSATTSFSYDNINYDSSIIMNYTRITDYEPDSIWDNISNILNTTGYSYILTQNINQTKKIYDTPNLIAYDYGFNIPTGSTISGIHVKINKNAFAKTTITNLSQFDETLFDSCLTTYTYDKLVTLGTSSFTSNNYNNYANKYIKEDITYSNDQYTVNSEPVGIWSDEYQTYLYGGINDIWSNDQQSKLSIDDVNNSNFSIIFGATQHIFKGDEEIPAFLSINNKREWYENKYISDISKRSFEYSKLYDIQVKIYYTIENTGYTLIDRSNIYTSANTLKTDDTYFKYQQCFNGVCYSYINSLNDIYKVSLMTGNNESINNMYNEYNIIDEYLPNLYHVDLATTDKIDLLSPYFKIDNTTLKPNHLILLMNQASGQSNDIYKVNKNYFLENANLLSTRDMSYRANIYISMGSHCEKQYFLQNDGNQFPITNEYKTFFSGHSYIVKHKINYNIYNTYTETSYNDSGVTSNQSKILFTDYNLARTLSENINWSTINIPLTSITIKYLNGSYPLYTQYDRKYYTMSGDTSLSSNTMFNLSGNTIFNIDTDFYNISDVGDHILVSLITGDFIDTEIIPSAKLNWFTTIKDIDPIYLTINDNIPGYIWNDIYNSGYSFRIRNLHYCSATTSDMAEYLNVSPYGDIISFTDIINSVEAKSKKNSDYYKYFDYNSIIISSSTAAYNFISNSQYQDYKLKPFLDKLGVTPTNIYNDAFILSGYTIEEVILDYELLHSRIYPLQSSMYKIYGTGLTSKFKPYTYIDFGKLSLINDTIISPYIISSDSARTLIYEVNENYMLIEKPRIDISLSISSGTYDIVNVSKIQDISDILYDLYLNYPHSYYYKYSDNVYNTICSQYATILKSNVFIRNLAMGILYQKNNLYNLDIFKMFIDNDYNHLNDVNLTYKPIELIDIGINKQTKIPIPLYIQNIKIEQECLFYTCHSTDNTIPEIYLYSATNFNNELYLNVKYQGIINFNNDQTPIAYQTDNYLVNNACLVLYTNTLFEKKLTYKHFYNSNTTNPEIFDLSIKSDNNNNTYHVGYTNSNFTNNLHSKIHLSSVSIDNIIDIDRVSKQYAGHILKYNSNYQTTTAITYEGSLTQSKIMVTDIINKNSNNFAYIATEDNYHQKFNNESSNQILVDDYNGCKSCALIKYSEDFKTIIWYRKFYATISNTGSVIDDNSGIIIDNNKYEHNYKISEDISSEYLFLSLSTTNGIELSYSDEHNISTTFGDLDALDYSVHIFKINSTTGYINWSIPIFIRESDFYTKKILHYNNSVYILLETKNTIKIDSIIYGHHTNNTYSLLICLNSDNGSVKWVKELGYINNTFTTDMIIYNGIYGEFLYVSGYYNNSTMIGNYTLTTNGGGSFVCKINSNSGEIMNIIDKQSTEIINVKTLSIINDSLYVGGEFKGYSYFNGNLKYSEYMEIFLEEIKINTI